MTAQPDNPGALVVDMGAVSATEVGVLNPSTIINAPNSFTLSFTMTISDLFAPLLAGESFDVIHFVQDIETGINTKLPQGSITAPQLPLPLVLSYTSQSYTTGTNGAPADLTTANASANFRILTQVRPTDPAKRTIVSAFQDGLILELI